MSLAECLVLGQQIALGCGGGTGVRSLASTLRVAVCIQSAFLAVLREHWH